MQFGGYRNRYDVRAGPAVDERRRPVQPEDAAVVCRRCGAGRGRRPPTRAPTTLARRNPDVECVVNRQWCDRGILLRDDGDRRSAVEDDRAFGDTRAYQAIVPPAIHVPPASLWCSLSEVVVLQRLVPRTPHLRRGDTRACP